jgi:hypothetical protein
MTNLEWYDTVLKVLALVGTAIAFLTGIWQYKKAQRWRRSEWVAQEVRSFCQDPIVQAALRMIDWGNRDVRLFTENSGTEGEIVHVTDDMVATSLQHHNNRPEGFSPYEIAIRDSFDRFLEGLERFESFRQANLITAADLKPHVAYWIYHIRAAKDDDRSVDRLVQLRSYIELYGYIGVQSLFYSYRDERLVSPPSKGWAKVSFR